MESARLAAGTVAMIMRPGRVRDRRGSYRASRRPDFRTFCSSLDNRGRIQHGNPITRERLEAGHSIAQRSGQGHERPRPAEPLSCIQKIRPRFSPLGHWAGGFASMHGAGFEIAVLRVSDAHILCCQLTASVACTGQIRICVLRSARQSPRAYRPNTNLAAISTSSLTLPLP